LACTGFVLPMMELKMPISVRRSRCSGGAGWGR
jgi:hypothetical protein